MSLGRSLAILLAGTLLCVAPISAQGSPDSEEWVQLFNGKDLSNWIVKIKGYELGDNFGDTFRVEDGLLKVSYNEYDDFQDRFGHIFHQEKFSYYIIAVEYRFVGDQAPGGRGTSRLGV